MGSSVSRSTSRTSGRVSRRSDSSDGPSTSLCDLGEGQARRALQVDVVRVDQCAQCAQRLTGEEVGFGALGGSVRARELRCGGRYIFQEAEQICHSFPLAVCQYGVIDAVFGASCAD
jgi:hypothetical protein